MACCSFGLVPRQPLMNGNCMMGKFQKIPSPFCHDATDVSSTLCSIWLWAGSYPSANIFWAGEMPFSHMAHAIQCMWMCVCVCGVYRPKFINTWRAKIPKKTHGKSFRQQNGINARPIHGWNLFIETCYSDGISHFGFLVARCSHEFTSISMMKASYIFFSAMLCSKNCFHFLSCVCTFLWRHHAWPENDDAILYRAHTNYHNLKFSELNVFFMSLLHICRHFSNYFPLWICQFVSSSVQHQQEGTKNMKKKARAWRTNKKTFSITVLSGRKMKSERHASNVCKWWNGTSRIIIGFMHYIRQYA